LHHLVLIILSLIMPMLASLLLTVVLPSRMTVVLSFLCQPEINLHSECLTSVLTDVLYIYICCFITITKFLMCWWSVINHLLSTAMKTLNLKYFGVKILISRGHVTLSERDYQTWQEMFPIGGQWWPCVYFARIRKYGDSKILGSRVWCFGVTWHHRLRDHLTRRGHFFISGQWWTCVYLAQIRIYGASKILGVTSLIF